MEREHKGLVVFCCGWQFAFPAFKTYDKDGGRMIPDNGRTPCVVFFFQFSAILTNFLSLADV